MRFIDEDESLVGQILEQGRRRLAGAPSRQPARVILDAGAGTGGLDHLEIEQRALFQPLCFQELALAAEPVEPRAHLFAHALDRLCERRTRCHIMRIGVDFDRIELGSFLPRQRIEFEDRIHLVAEQGDAPGTVLVMRRENVDDVAAHPEAAARESLVVAAILQRHQPRQQLGALHALAARNPERHAGIGLHGADAVDAGHRRDDDDVIALQDRARRRMAHPVDLFVYGRILLDIGVRARDIGFRLVVIVIGDEIFDRVFRKKSLHFGVELGRQRLVRCQDEGRALQPLDHLRHGEGLARTGDAQQHLVALRLRERAFAAQARDQLLDRGRLIAGRLIVRDQFEALAAFALFRSLRPMRHERRQLRSRHMAESRRRFG